MDRTSAAYYATVGGLRMYQDANPGAGISVGTGIAAADRNAVQEEILGIIEGFGSTANAANLKQAFAAIEAGIAAALLPYRQVAPTSVTSTIGLAIAASYSDTLSLSFTASAAGAVMAFSTMNLSNSAAADITNILAINGTTVQNDGTTTPQVHQGHATVTSGEAVTVTLAVTSGSGTSPSTNATYSVSAFFLPSA